jgi:hypothetical protein
VEAERLSRFVEGVAALARLDGTVREDGASRYWTGMNHDRAVAVGTNGSEYWVAVGLELNGVPVDAEVVWAPLGTYARVQFLEEGGAPPITGDDEFDALYLLLGAGAERLAHWLTPEARRAFVMKEPVHPSLHWFDIVAMARRLHLRCYPPLYRGVPGRWFELGVGPFSPERASQVVSDMVQLAVELEQAQGRTA